MSEAMVHFILTSETLELETNISTILYWIKSFPEPLFYRYNLLSPKLIVLLILFSDDGAFVFIFRGYMQVY